MPAIRSAHGAAHNQTLDARHSGDSVRCRESLKTVALLLLVLLIVPVLLGYRVLKRRQRDNALIQAILAHRSQQALALLKQGADPNASGNASSSTSLWKLLRDVPVESRNPLSAAPERFALLLAVTNGEEDVACALVEKGASFYRAKQMYGEPIVVLAVEKRMPRLARLLLDRRADRGTDSTRVQLLCRAAEQGYADLVLLMLQRGTDVNGGIDPKTGVTSQDTLRPQPATLFRLRARGVFYTESQETPLQAAAANGRLDVVHLLGQHGAAINVKVDRGQTALMAAAKRGDDAMVGYLIAHGADVNAGGRMSGSALQRAEKAGHLSTVRLLVKEGAGK